MTYWKHVHHADVRARLMADEHYNRQTPGAREFTPPGNKIVLLGLNDDAVWASHRPDPTAGKEVAYRRDGMDYWDNPIFRREPTCPIEASELIRQALAITLFLWGYDDIPVDGFHTFIDPKHVKPIKRHGEIVYGWVYHKTELGFEEYPERTKARDLVRLVLPAAQLCQIAVLNPIYEQSRLFA